MIAPPSIEFELSDRSPGCEWRWPWRHSTDGKTTQSRCLDQHRLSDPQDAPALHGSRSRPQHCLQPACGGSCLEQLELRRKDEGYLNTLVAERIPDPTTAGDFCRRFNSFDVMALQELFHDARWKVWSQQPDSFFDQAVIEGDGTQVEALGVRKEGMAMNYKGEWGYHPLIITLANTRELLYVWNRSGSRPSHARTHIFFDRAIDVCRRSFRHFRHVLLKGDTDFSQSRHLDRWHNDNV